MTQEILQKTKERINRKNHAIEFAQWLGKDHIMHDDGVWLYCPTGDKVGTTEQLYEIWLWETKTEE